MRLNNKYRLNSEENEKKKTKQTERFFFSNSQMMCAQQADKEIIVRASNMNARLTTDTTKLYFLVNIDESVCEFLNNFLLRLLSQLFTTTTL